MTDDDLSAFLAALDRLPRGSSRGSFQGKGWTVTVKASADGRRIRLYGEELAGTGRVSFNLYHLATGGVVLRPCEMPADQVTGFVRSFAPDAGRAGSPPRPARGPGSGSAALTS